MSAGSRCIRAANAVGVSPGRTCTSAPAPGGTSSVDPASGIADCPSWLAQRIVGTATEYSAASVDSVCPGCSTMFCAGFTASAVTVADVWTIALISIAARFRSAGAGGGVAGLATSTTRVAAVASTHRCRTKR